MLQHKEAGLYDSRIPLGPNIVPNEILLKWHVIASDYTKHVAIDTETLEYYLTELNIAFEPAGLKFVADPVIHYIWNDDWYENGASTYDIRRESRLHGAMNVYWANTLIPNSLCGQGSFSFTYDQGIVMNNSCSGESDVHGVFIHEVGHYFDLLHTHTFECPEALKCEREGDFVCDTPPSPRLWFDACVNASTCDLWKDANENCNTTAHPACEETQYDVGINTINYMSYTEIPCLTEFTQGQYIRAISTYENLRRELHNVPIPQCVGDLTGDGLVDAGDIGLLLAEWGEVTGDLNGDSFTDGADLAFILSNWGTCRN